MKWLKLFEDFKDSKVSVDDIIECIEKGGSIYAQIVKEYPDNDPENPIKPVNIDEDGSITVEIDGNHYEVELKDVDRIDYE
jgi:Ca2+-binding EF-hand superfamily protein